MSRSLGLPSDLRKLVRQAEAQGWSIARTRKSHFKWTSPAGAVVIASGTPEDPRARKNLLAQLRRAGLETQR